MICPQGAAALRPAHGGARNVRVADHVWNLRSRRSCRVIEQCLADALGRFGLRVIEFTILGNHIHLIVEANSSEALSRGMQGLCIRIAKGLNRMMRASGSVFSDHFHSRVVKTPTELVRAIAYVLGNRAPHIGAATEADPYSSSSLPPARRGLVLGRPKTWLLREGWRRARVRQRGGSQSVAEHDFLLAEG
jgi:REP element-mobilizing transposase RayT